MNAEKIWVKETRKKVRERDRDREKWRERKMVKATKVCDHSEILLPYKSHL